MTTLSTFTYAKKYFVSSEIEFVTEPDLEFNETYKPPEDLINLLADNIVVYDRVGIGSTTPTSNLTVNGSVLISGISTANIVNDSSGNVRIIPQNLQTSSYILVASDRGKHINITTGGVTVPVSVFSVGDVVTIYNNSGTNQTITQGSTTLRQSGTANTGNRTLAQYGLATILCVASNTFVISGAGLS